MVAEILASRVFTKNPSSHRPSVESIGSHSKSTEFRALSHISAELRSSRSKFEQQDSDELRSSRSNFPIGSAEFRSSRSKLEQHDSDELRSSRSNSPIGSVEFQSSHSKFEQQDPDEYQSSHRDPMQRTSIEPRSLMSTDVTSRDIQQGSGEVYGFKHIGNKTYRLSSELGTYLMSYFSFYYIWYLCCMKTEVHKVLYKFGYGVDVRSVCKTMRVPTLEIGNWENLGRVQCMRVFRTFLLCILFLFGVYPPPSFAEGGKIGMAVVLFSKQGKGCLATHHSIQSNSLQESNLTYKFIYEFGFDPGGPSPKSFMIPRDGGIFISPRQEEDPGSPSLMVLDTKRVSEVCRRDDIYISSEQAGKFKPKDYVEEIMTYISEEIVEEATKRVSEELCGNDIFDYSEPGAGLIDEVSGFSPAEQSFSSSGNNGTGGTTEGIVELYESFSLDSPCDTVGFDSESFVQFCFRFPVDGVCKLDSQIPLMPILTEGSHSMDPPENSKKRKTIEGGADSVVYLNDRNADLAGDDFFSQFPVQDSPAKSKHKGKVRLVFHRRPSSHRDLVLPSQIQLRSRFFCRNSRRYWQVGHQQKGGATCFHERSYDLVLPCYGACRRPDPVSLLYRRSSPSPRMVERRTSIAGWRSRWACSGCGS